MKRIFITLVLTFTGVSSVFACSHLAMGIPKSSDHLFCGKGFAVGYNYQNRAPDWVSYQVNVKQISSTKPNEESPTKFQFRTNRNIPLDYQANPEEFENTQWQIGQFANPDAINSSTLAKAQTFAMFGTVPIHSEGAFSLWQKLSQTEVKLLDKYSTLHVFSGGLYQYIDDYFGSNSVAIPSHLWKVFYEPNSKIASAYLIPNNGNIVNDNLPHYLVSVAEIEEKTGINLLKRLDETLQDKLESKPTSLFY